VTSGPAVDVVRSLAPWVTVYDADGTPLASSGSYLGKAPVIPDQARADARAGELSFTWEPVDGLRMATIVEPFPGGMVVAARSMQHEEEQQTRTLAIAAAAWIAALTAAGIGAALGVWVGDRAASSH
jgi:hypothetical protein